MMFQQSSEIHSGRGGIDLIVNLDGPLIPRRKRTQLTQSADNTASILFPPLTPPILKDLNEIEELTKPYGEQLINIEEEKNIFEKRGYIAASEGSYSVNDEFGYQSESLPSIGNNWSLKLQELSHKCEIEYSQLNFVSKLGEGAFGEVWRAQLWDLEVAVKKLKGNFLRASPVEELAEEVALLKSLHHPNCVLFLGFTKPPNFCIITEYMNLGSLRSILNNDAIRITNKIMIKIAISIARGMNYLHTQSPAILHRDLNSHNILSTTNWTIKVADYGLSRTINATMDFCGAVPWRAPEVDRGVYLPASDVYSFGILLWEIVSRRLPWEGWEMEKIVKAVKSGIRLDIPINCPKLFSDLIQQCCQQNPEKRPTFHEIINQLKPYENLSSRSLGFPSFFSSYQTYGSTASSFMSNIHSTASTTTSPINSFVSTDQMDLYSSSSDLLIFNESTMISRCWESFISFSSINQSLDFISSQSNAMSSFIKGALCLVDNLGRLMWIVGLDSRDSVIKEEKHIHSKTNEIRKFASLLCAPISRETMKLFTFSLKPGAKAASVTHLSIQEGMKSLSLYEDMAISDLQQCSNWCGNIILGDLESSRVIIIVLFKSEEDINKLESSGYFQQQLINFQNIIDDIPIFQRYSVKLDTFNQLSLNSSPSTVLRNASRSQRLESEGFDSLTREFVIIPHPSEERKRRIRSQGSEVLDSFICALHHNMATYYGKLEVTRERIYFKRVLGREQMALHFTEIKSLDKNQVSAIPGSKEGHSIECTSMDGRVFLFKGLLHREELIRLIVSQLAKLDSSHTIKLLIGGEPVP